MTGYGASLPGQAFHEPSSQRLNDRRTPAESRRDEATNFIATDPRPENLQLYETPLLTRPAAPFKAPHRDDQCLGNMSRRNLPRRRGIQGFVSHAR